MSERNHWYNQNGEKERQERYDHDDHGQSERKNYGHINERVEETDSTKNPPKER